jgi:cysteine-rich repeat protein
MASCVARSARVIPLLLLLTASSPAHAADGLAFLGTAIDGTAGVNGLKGAQSVAISPDGAHVYVAGSGDSAIAVFRRNTASGTLAFVEQQRQNAGGVQGLGGAAAVAVSPDGANVYAAGTQDDSVAVFARDAASGALSFVELKRDQTDDVTGLAGPTAVAVSPDGAHLYVASGAGDAIAIFARDAGTGELTFVSAERAQSGASHGLKGARAIALSPNGLNLYVAGNNESALGVFARDPASGALAFVEVQRQGQNNVVGLGGAISVAVSPDGLHVYVAGKVDDAVAVFSRNPDTGALTFVEADRQAFAGVDGLDGIESVTVAPDGLHVYTAASVGSAVAVFARDAATGSLTFLHRQIDGIADVAGLGGAAAVAVSPDAASVYVASKSENGLVAFDARCGDGALAANEQCDDGNAAGGDGCSPGCRLECAAASDCDDGDVCTEERCRGGECALPRCGYDGGICQIEDAMPVLQTTEACMPLRAPLARLIKAQLRAARVQIRIVKHQGVCLKHAKHHGPCIKYTRNPTAKELAKLVKTVKNNLTAIHDRAVALQRRGRISGDCLAALDAQVNGLGVDVKAMVLHKGVCAL